MIVLALLTDARAIRTLQRAHELTDLRWFGGKLIVETSTAELEADLDEHPFAVVVADPYWSGEFDLEWLRAIALRSASGLIAYADFTDRPAGRDVARLLRVGVHHVVTLGADDDGVGFASVLDHAFGADMLRTVVEPITDDLPLQQRLAVKWAVREGWCSTSVRAMAEALGVDGRTLRRWFSDMEEVGPKRALAWGRLLVAGLLINKGPAAPPEVASLLGFSSCAQLRRQYFTLVKRRLNADPPEELFQVVVSRFKAAFRRNEAS